MAKLKEKILQALKNSSQLEITLDDVSKSQENLLKNHSNPVFNQKDKNKILKKIIDLQNIAKSLHRYNKLNENNYVQDAQEEKENIETTVLKGGISYNKYIWHSENSENTCDLCKSLDGKEFDFYDEVPQRPHPNCKCTVENLEEPISEDESETSIEENENKIPSENPNPQPEQKSPQPTPPPKNPPHPQTQRWIKPCNGPIVGKYGEPRSTHTHNGIDIAVPVGTSIKAVADGTVIRNGKADGYGNWVVIDHGNINGVRVTSEYGHLSSWSVKIGQKVKKGEEIAKSGNTGYSQGPHLHITIRNGVFQGRAVDPAIYIDF